MSQSKLHVSINDMTELSEEIRKSILTRIRPVYSAIFIKKNRSEQCSNAPNSYVNVRIDILENTINLHIEITDVALSNYLDIMKIQVFSITNKSPLNISNPEIQNSIDEFVEFFNTESDKLKACLKYFTDSKLCPGLSMEGGKVLASYNFGGVYLSLLIPLTIVKEYYNKLDGIVKVFTNQLSGYLAYGTATVSTVKHHKRVYFLVGREPYTVIDAETVKLADDVTKKCVLSKVSIAKNVH